MLFPVVGVFVFLVLNNPSPGGIAGASFGLFFLSYVLYLLLSRKGTKVFSREYHDLIAQTPHIAYRWSCLFKICVYGFVGLVSISLLIVLVTSVIRQFK